MRSERTAIHAPKFSVHMLIGRRIAAAFLGLVAAFAIRQARLRNTSHTAAGERRVAAGEFSPPSVEPITDTIGVEQSRLWRTFRK